MFSVIEKVSEETLEKIQQDFEENSERLKKYVNLFKEWLECEKHLPRELDEKFIENYIRLCKYDLEKTKTKFERYIIAKHSMEHLRDDFVLETNFFMQHDIFRALIIAPKLNPDLTRTLYCGGTDNVKNYNYKWRQKWILNMSEYLLHSGLNIGTGFVLVADFQSVSTQLLAKLDFGIERKFFNLILNMLPAKFKQLHFVNVPTSAKPLVALVKACCSEKMRKRIIFHDDVEGLKNYLPADTLPVEYNGTSGESLENWGKSWVDLYVNSDEIRRKCKVLELRGEIPKHKLHLDPTSGFGLNGSFRQLELD